MIEICIARWFTPQKCYMLDPPLPFTNNVSQNFAKITPPHPPKLIT